MSPTYPPLLNWGRAVWTTPSVTWTLIAYGELGSGATYGCSDVVNHRAEALLQVVDHREPLETTKTDTRLRSPLEIPF